LAVGDSARAIELLRTAAEAMPEHEIAWSNYGVAALRLERWSEAAEAFEHAVELGNDDLGTRLNLGTAWVRVDQCEKGLGVLDRLVDEHPELWQAQYWRWSCLSQAGRGDEAAAALKAYESGRERVSNSP
jgi:superkiller protein 3